MKKIISLITIFLFSSSLCMASFPVKRGGDNNIVIENNIDSSISLNNSIVSSAVANVSIGGFVMGLLLGLIGVGLVYIFSDDELVRRSSWYGVGVWIILLLLIGL